MRPVCGPCAKHHRQCLGFGSRRLIIRDETDDTISRFSMTSSSMTAMVTSPSSSDSQLNCEEARPPTPDASRQTSAMVAKEFRPLLTNLTQFYPIENQRLYNDFEQLQLAIFCCRKTVGLRTLTWVMSNAKWLETLPNAMQISEALTCAVRANAANYLARAAGAQTTPHHALTEYGSALRFLQRDLYTSAKQTSNETLMTVLLLGIFDVNSP